MQLQQVEYPSRLARKYPNQVIVTRIGVGIWLMVLTAIFCSMGWWWGLALLAPAALHSSISPTASTVLRQRRGAERADLRPRPADHPSAGGSDSCHVSPRGGDRWV